MPGVYFGPFGSQFGTHAEPAGGNCGLFPLGHKLILPDGREYRYTLNDGTAEVAGNIYASVAPEANHGGSTGLLVDTARAVGDTVISATLGATLAAIDIYSEGFIAVSGTTAATGQGTGYRIRRAIAAGQAHAAVASQGVITVNLEPGETVQVALTVTTSEVGLLRNRHHSVVLAPASTATALMSGVSPGICAADRYYYGQVRGLAAVAAAASCLIGDVVVPSTGTAGHAMPSAAFHTDGPAIGTVARIAATNEFAIVNLSID